MEVRIFTQNHEDNSHESVYTEDNMKQDRTAKPDLAPESLHDCVSILSVGTRHCQRRSAFFSISTAVTVFGSTNEEEFTTKQCDF